MTKLVRATNPVTGATFTTSEANAKARKLKYTAAEGAATDRFGRIRPATPRTDLGSSATTTTTPAAPKASGSEKG